MGSFLYLAAGVRGISQRDKMRPINLEPEHYSSRQISSPMLTKTQCDQTWQWLDIAVRRLQAVLDPEQIILFGSWARGTASRRSDIDLFIVLETTDPPLTRIGTVLDLLTDAPRSIDVIVYTPDELARRAHSPFIRRLLQEGQVLYEQRKS